LNNCNSHIPIEVIGPLELGEDFCLSPNDKPKLTIEYIKHVENNFSKFHQYNCINTCRSKICLYINQIKNIDCYRTETDLKILSALSTTKKFITNNPDIIFTRADKGNSVVTLNRIDYIAKMETQFSQYLYSRYNVILSINYSTRDLKAMLKRWLNSKYISTHTHSILNSSNAVLPKTYRLPKIHTLEIPLIIFSLSGCPLHNLANFLHEILNLIFSTFFSYIHNSPDHLKKLTNLHLPDDVVLVSLDVVSLFINVPVNLVLEILEEKRSYIHKHTLKTNSS